MATLALVAALMEKKVKRKRNINFGFLPAHPTRADLAKSRREFKAHVRERTKEIRRERVRLGKSARAAFPGKKKLEALFHEVYGKNPRELPAMTAQQMAAIDKYLRGQEMAAKKRTKKKKNGKGRMPAGLKAYWAKKRGKKAKRNPRRKKRNPRAKTRTRTIVKYKYRTRTVKVRAKRRRKPNPRKPAMVRVNLGSGFTPKQIKKVGRLVARAMGKRAKFQKP
jgi:hypothetical protein